MHIQYINFIYYFPPLKTRAAIKMRRWVTLDEQSQPNKADVTQAKATRTYSFIATVKWYKRGYTSFLSSRFTTMTNGAGRREWHKGEAIIIRRADVERAHDHAQTHSQLRDFVIVRVIMKIGLRTTEICTLCVEHIEFSACKFKVLDSKKKRFYPLPLDVLTLQYIKDLVGDKHEGYVFIRQDSTAGSNSPLSRKAVWQIVREIGEAAGVKNLNPRVLRHYFAAHWVYVDRKPKQDLQLFLRHTNPLTTELYLSRLRFAEDLDKIYHEKQSPFADARQLSEFYRKHCATCIHESTCKFVDQVGTSPWASGCRFYKQKKEMIV